MSNVGAPVRRIPIKGPSDPDEAEERRRKGREYLARRNQEMYELQQRRKEKARADGAETPPTPTSFDAMVDDEGKLRLVDNETNDMPDPPTSVPVPEKLQAEMAEVERNLNQPMLVDASSSSASAWQSGSRMANPFDDENAMDMDRSSTPKPPVPPKIALEELPPRPLEEQEEPRAEPSRMPGRFTPVPEHSRAERIAQAAADARPDMTYEEQEQLAIALSLSEQERKASEDAERRRSQAEEEDAELRAAILASLREQQASASSSKPADPAPLIDVTESNTAPAIQQPAPRGHWETLFDQQYSPAHEPLSSHSQSAASTAEEDELYRVTPQLTRARLASLNAQTPPSAPYDPVREAAASHHQPAAVDESFYSAASPVRSAPPSRPHSRSRTLSPSPNPPHLIDPTVPQTPSTTSESTDTFASLSALPPRDQISTAAPSTRNEDSDADVEVLDISGEDDSDVDMLSELGAEGRRTPDSWTEVGSEEGNEGRVGV